MNHDNYDDDYIRSILNGVKSIAMVGASPVNVRPSYFAFKYLAERGYDMIPVNPGHVGKNLVGKPFVASLADMAGIDRDHVVTALRQIFEGEITRPHIDRRCADHRDRFHAVEDSADVIVVISIVVHCSVTCPATSARAFR